MYIVIEHFGVSTGRTISMDLPTVRIWKKRGKFLIKSSKNAIDQKMPLIDLRRFDARNGQPSGADCLYDWVHCHFQLHRPNASGVQLDQHKEVVRQKHLFHVVADLACKMPIGDFRYYWLKMDVMITIQDRSSDPWGLGKRIEDECLIMRSRQISWSMEIGGKTPKDTGDLVTIQITRVSRD